MTGMLIIGGGLAGAKAAETFRAEGYEGPVTLVAGEAHYPYERPPLSKEIMQGKAGEEKAFTFTPEWYDEHNVTVHTGSPAAKLDPVAHEVTLENGEVLGYDKVLLVTGSSARQLPIEGHDLAGVHYLRTLDDAHALRDLVKDGGKKLVLIGSGWIGMEMAAAARQLGNEVIVLEREEVPLQAALGQQLGQVFQQMHVDQGVDLRTQVNVERIVGADGRVSGVVVDGETVPADAVLIGIGAVPNTKLAEDARIDVYRGILTNAWFRTSEPDVYAAGDVANVYHPVLQRHIRSEHWATALKTGPAAAKAMLGQKVHYREIPYYYTDQFDLGMELVGYPPLMARADLHICGDTDKREFVAFWVLDGRVVAGMNVNIWDVVGDIKDLINSEAQVDLDKLTDPSVEIKDVRLA